jgi:cytochrome c-type biogenesis protein CcmH
MRLQHNPRMLHLSLLGAPLSMRPAVGLPVPSRQAWGTSLSAPRFALLLTLVLLLMLAVQTPGNVALAQNEQSQEDRARALDKQIICPVCPGETLNQSQATLAKQMRGIIRERLAAGQSESEITAYFVSVYGDSVLAAPPLSGFSLTAWLVPVLGLLAGVAALMVTVRALRRPLAPASADGGALAQEDRVPDGAELERYLRLVDEEVEGKARKTQEGLADAKGDEG